MQKLPLNLLKRIEQRIQENSFREFSDTLNLSDFSSNDYLGFASSEVLFSKTYELLSEKKSLQNGATGSRLLSGNHFFFKPTEELISSFHETESALIFNSGYDANIGLFSSVPQKEDLILYDELVHASIRDGIKMSNAKAHKFLHNDLEDLRKKIFRKRELFNSAQIYIVTESVFSMDGDLPNLIALSNLAKEHKCLLIIDEAHATGVFGKKGQGLVQELKIQDTVFARIVTFGKALGCHGAAILGSKELKEYLINFSRSFIYTTALPPHSVACILEAYKSLETSNGTNSEVIKLQENIRFFKEETLKNGLNTYFIKSESAIHCCIIPGNETVKKLAAKIQANGFDIKAILSPTVPKGKERLRICLHSFNTKEDIQSLVKLLATFIK
ncbi:aminotransferase class I/II-fold pyridoxal phosphate-dependent enzyme [Gillisia limnaea]|uniref:Aminotransferase class I and II n=1 Tax=Gillisia limnaea (strain DSM 15749 / LMG 21470 / R-8282) TaxID=865937 RepID=H2BSM6_GILLR|nr:pyridoxal phosphate-dependent aminotransferase family protein [Gillisia limnaea]EHQ03612.1 aminotransferase class I and II [Gillisia limnaea DSM 15749]